MNCWQVDTFSPPPLHLMIVTRYVVSERWKNFELKLESKQVVTHGNVPEAERLRPLINRTVYPLTILPPPSRDVDDHFVVANVKTQNKINPSLIVIRCPTGLL